MRKVFSALIIAAFIFVCLNFLYSNLNDQAFNYPLSFRFEIPLLFALRTEPVPLGFVVITGFSLGIVFLACLQAIPALFKSIAVRSRDRRIRELEKELEETKKAAPMTGSEPDAAGSSEQI